MTAINKQKDAVKHDPRRHLPAPIVRDEEKGLGLYRLHENRHLAEWTKLNRPDHCSSLRLHGAASLAWLARIAELRALRAVGG